MPIDTGPIGNSPIGPNTVPYPSTSGYTAASGYVTINDTSWYVTTTTQPNLMGTDPAYMPPKNPNEVEIKDIEKGMFIAIVIKNILNPTISGTGEPLEVLNVNDPFVLAQTFDKKVFSLDKNNHKFIKLNDEYVKILKDAHENKEEKANRPKMERAIEL